MHLLHLPHQPVVLVFSHLQVVAERRQAGVLALQTSLELHHGPLQLGGVLPQCADLGSEGALLLLAELRLRLLRVQLSVHRSQLSLKLRLLLESLEQKDSEVRVTTNSIVNQVNEQPFGSM